MSLFCQAGLEACNFKHKAKCNPCWGKNCNRQGGSKPPRIKQTPRETKVPVKKEKPQEERIGTKVVSW